MKVDRDELSPGGRRGIPTRFRISALIPDFKTPPWRDRMIVRSKGAAAQGPARFPGDAPCMGAPGGSPAGADRMQSRNASLLRRGAK